jgi:hypothetical protein
MRGGQKHCSTKINGVVPHGRRGGDAAQLREGKINLVCEDPIAAELADAPRRCRNEELLPVSRKYQLDPTAVEELVEVIYTLLIDAPIQESVTASQAEPTCFNTESE